MEHETLKIPDIALLKISRKEVGQLTSEVAYLENEIMRYRKLIVLLVRMVRKITKQFKAKVSELNGFDKEVQKELRRENTYRGVKKKYQKEVDVLNKKVSTLTEYRDLYFDLLAKTNKNK